jgi:hypothetical protein
MGELESLTYRITEQLYQQRTAGYAGDSGATAGATSGTATSGDDVIDAEYREEK